MGKQTFIFKNRPVIVSAFSVVGTEEGRGPMGEWFDFVSDDDTFGEKTWEKSESKMLKTAIEQAILSSGRTEDDIDVILSGDLLNQIMSSSFMARDLRLPFIGLYGACSTMTESLMMAAVMTDGGYCDYAVNGASSHFCSAERQFRMPLEHGNQKPPYAQSTVIGAGAMVLSGKRKAAGNNSVCVTAATVGKVIDQGIKDSNQMGAAMAPAAVDTILTHFSETGNTIDDYDAIVTGDLGYIGKNIAMDLLKTAGVPAESLENKFMDCGEMIYGQKNDCAGGSGCGCSGSLLAGYFYKQLKKGSLKRILALSTGALLSTVSPFQGESIPGIAHAVVLEYKEGVK